MHSQPRLLLWPTASAERAAVVRDRPSRVWGWSNPWLCRRWFDFEQWRPLSAGKGDVVARVASVDSQAPGTTESLWLDDFDVLGQGGRLDGVVAPGREG